MKRLTALFALAACIASMSAPAATLIRGATVHTLTSAGTLESTDVLIDNGRIAEIGRGLRAPDGAEIIDAAGRPLTPGLFGGLGHLGLEEIGLEPPAADARLGLGAMRPEFDVTLAFNPDSAAVEVNRAAGITFAMLMPSAAGEPGPRGGSILTGQGGIVTLDAGLAPVARAMFVDIGGDANVLSGGSRAAQFMLLEQAFTEARTPDLLRPGDPRQLTPIGRRTLRSYLDRGGPFVFHVDRAADILQVLAFARREKVRAVISGGVEAWRVARELAAADVPVILDPLENLPQSFDEVGATLENAARLHAAGVRIAFSLADTEPHNIRKIRQAAGNAVAHGLPWDVGLAAITRVPAEIFGVGDRMGSIAVGRPADLVLWSGDPLEVTSLADHVFIGGEAQPLATRQTELRDRYLERVRRGAAR